MTLVQPAHGAYRSPSTAHRDPEQPREKNLQRVEYSGALNRGPTRRSSGLRPAALLGYFAKVARRAEAAQLWTLGGRNFHGFRSTSACDYLRWSRHDGAGSSRVRLRGT